MTDEFKFDTSQITTLDERFGKCPYATAQSLISGKWAPPILLNRKIAKTFSLSYRATVKQ